MGSKLAFKQEIAIHIIQNEAMVVFLELFKRETFSETTGSYLCLFLMLSHFDQ